MKKLTVAALAVTALLSTGCEEETTVEKKIYIQQSQETQDATSTSESSVATKINLTQAVQFNNEEQNIASTMANINKFNIVVESSEYDLSQYDLTCININAARTIPFKGRYDSESKISTAKVIIENYDPNTNNIECKLTSKLDPSEKIGLEKQVALKDYLISGSMNLAETRIVADKENKIGRLVFINSGELYTNGKNLNINAQEIIVQPGMAGEIRTFMPSDTIAQDNTAGLSGGHIQINAQKASGDLRIAMEGQSAGKFTHKLSQTTKELIYKNIECVDREHSSKGIVKTLYSSTPDRKGFDGLRGGDSGQFTLSVEDSEDLTFSYKITEGAGSLGGEGLVGGLYNFRKSTLGGKQKKHKIRTPMSCGDEIIEGRKVKTQFANGISYNKTNPSALRGEKGEDGQRQQSIIFLSGNLSYL